MRRLQLSFATHVLHGLKMLGGRIVGGLRLHQYCPGSIQIAAGNGSFGKELLAAVHNTGIQVEIRLGLRKVEFGLLHIFRDLRLGGRSVCGLSGLVRAFIVLRGRSKIGILKHRQQLALLHARPALYIELFDRRRNLGHDGGLRQRGKNGIGSNVFGNRPFLRVFGLDRHFRRRSLFFLAPCGEKNRNQNDD